MYRPLPSRAWAGWLLLATLTAALCFSPVLGFDVSDREREMPDSLKTALQAIDFAAFDVRAKPVELGDRLAAGTGPSWWAGFRARHSDEWRVSLDERTGQPLLISGKGIPLVPGKGNSLRAPAFGGPAPTGEPMRLQDVAGVTRGFLDANRDVLGVDPANLVFDAAASKGLGRSNRYWTIKYQQVVRDPVLGIIPVRDARVFFRTNAGNVTQFGSHLAVTPTGISTDGIISREQAVATIRTLLDNPADVRIQDAVPDIGQADRSVLVVPENLPDGSLGHRLVRALTVATDELDMELWLDAHTGTLVYAIDNIRTIDAQVRGGVYPVTNTEPEELRGMPYIEVDNNGIAKDADSAGVYDYTPPGSVAAADISGDHVRVDDECGISSVSTSLSPGDLNFGRGLGTDCTTPGYGGPGNTHAARSTYYHLNLIKEKARAYLDIELTDPHWLNDQLRSNTNLTGDYEDGAYCNAYWDGWAVNFFRSFDVSAWYELEEGRDVDCSTNPGVDILCSNTGELPGIFLHEFAHGLDDNIYSPPTDLGSGEAYADTMALLQTHVSCIGHNFRMNCPCRFGCDASCTGVRDIAVRPHVRPSNIEDAPADCDQGTLTCPYFTRRGFPYQGPMGYEGHCESLIASGAIWDMIQGFVGRYGEGAGWALGDRLWHESLQDLGDAYQIVSGGTCNPDADIDGCGADNWYTVLLAVDDDNGDLTDGTPNADLIWTAFNNHGIACGAAAPPVSSTCSVLAAPASLTATAVTGEVSLSWPAVTDAVSYRVFRNPISCSSGSTPIAEVTAPAVAYVDGEVTNGTTYYYAVQAVGADDICVSPFSDCEAASPMAPLVPADIFMVLDESGSMSGATEVAGERKIDALEDAALMVMDLVADYADDGFQLGAVSFSTDVTGSESLKDLSVDTERAALESFIEDLEPDDLTAIGLGMNDALSMLSASPQRKVVMLLSDGMQNVPPELELDTTLPGVTIGGSGLPSDVYFYAVALGTTIDEDLFDDLANQGGIPSFYYGGSTTDIQTAFALWIADVLGLDVAGSPSFAPESGFAAAPADVGAESRLVERYRINPSVRRVTFLVTWKEKARELRFRLETPVGPISLNEHYFHPDHGFGLVTIDVPIQGQAPDAHVGEWRLIVESDDASLAAASAVPPSFIAHAFYDDPALELRYNAGGEDPGAGEPLPLRVEVLENGKPVSGLTVRARATGPETGLGDILSESRVAGSASAATPSVAVVAPTPAPAGDRPPTEAAQKLALLLEQDPSLLQFAPRDAVSLSESHPGVYEAQLPASATAAAGTYDFRFEVEGTTPQNGPIQREQRFSRYLRIKPDPDATLVGARLLPGTKEPTVRFSVKPVDRNGHRLGPGWGRYVVPDASAGRLVGDVTDNLDGSYVFDLAIDPHYAGPLRINILGSSILAEVPPLGGAGVPHWLLVLLIILLLLWLLWWWRRVV